MKKYLFIINPIAGKGKPGKIIELLNKRINETEFDFKTIYTRKDQPVKELLPNNFSNIFDGIFAVGGDGTINEVAALLINTNIPLGIIPVGSGNGLARHLNIPLDPEKAIKNLINGNVKTIDVGFVNDLPFLNIAGVGFDALIADLFSKNKAGRGFWNYLSCSIKGWFSFESESYCIKIKEKEVRGKAFLVEVANGSQFGNNFYIAPGASLSDGLLDIVIIQPLRIWNMPDMILKVLRKKLHKSSKASYYKGVLVEITSLNKKKLNTHLDGEPIKLATPLKFHLQSKCLDIMVPENNL